MTTGIASHEYDTLTREAFGLHRDLLASLEDIVDPTLAALGPALLSSAKRYSTSSSASENPHQQLLSETLRQSRSDLQRLQDKVAKWSFATEPSSTIVPSLSDADVIPLAQLRQACPTALQGRVDQLVLVFRTLIEEANRFWALTDLYGRATAECHRQRALILSRHVYAFPCQQLASKFLDYYREQYNKLYLPQEKWFLEQERRAHDEQCDFYARFDPFVQHYASTMDSLLQVLKRELESVRQLGQQLATTNKSAFAKDQLPVTQIQQVQDAIAELEQARDVWSSTSTANRQHSAQTFVFFPITPQLFAGCCSWIARYHHALLQLANVCKTLCAASSSLPAPASLGMPVTGRPALLEWAGRQSQQQQPTSTLSSLVLNRTNERAVVKGVAEECARSARLAASPEPASCTVEDEIDGRDECDMNNSNSTSSSTELPLGSKLGRDSQPAGNMVKTEWLTSSPESAAPALASANEAAMNVHETASSPSAEYFHPHHHHQQEQHTYGAPFGTRRE